MGRESQVNFLDYSNSNKKEGEMSSIIPGENVIAFKLECKECSFKVECGEISIVESLVNVTDHIENTGHDKYDLEIYDFDLMFIKEARDIAKLFESNDSVLSTNDMISRLKDIGYENAGSVIKRAIDNDILCIDDIDDNNNGVIFALTELGKDIWEELKENAR